MTKRANNTKRNTEPVHQTMVNLCRRTNDPKLRWIEARLDEAGIPHVREGKSFHAPILKVPEPWEDLALSILRPIDDHDDYCSVFATPWCVLDWDAKILSGSALAVYQAAMESIRVARTAHIATLREIVTLFDEAEEDFSSLSGTILDVLHRDGWVVEDRVGAPLVGSGR